MFLDPHGLLRGRLLLFLRVWRQIVDHIVKLPNHSITDTITKIGDEIKMDVWYPARTDLECVTAYRSFFPVIMYYHARLADWSLYFRTCKVCGRIFLAKSQKYTMCSDKCRQKMKTQAKRDVDARAIENRFSDHWFRS